MAHFDITKGGLRTTARRRGPAIKIELEREIQSLVEYSDMTQTEIARHLGVSQSTVSRRKKKESKMSFRVELLVGDRWEGNGCRFATVEEARAYARDTMRRWIPPQDYRVLGALEAATHSFDEEKRALIPLVDLTFPFPPGADPAPTPVEKPKTRAVRPDDEKWKYMKQGDRAFYAGKPLIANPHNDLPQRQWWLDGYNKASLKELEFKEKMRSLIVTSDPSCEPVTTTSTIRPTGTL